MTIVQNNSIKNDVQTVLIRNFSEPLIIDNSDRNEVRRILNLSKIHSTIFTLKKETSNVNVLRILSGQFSQVQFTECHFTQPPIIPNNDQYHSIQDHYTH